MKYLITSFLLLNCLIANSQTTWLFDKSIKTISFLGKGIKSYNRTTKELLPDRVSEANGIKVKLDTAKIDSSEVTEFVSSTKDFYLGFFSNNSANITSVKIYNPIEYSLNFETIKVMPNNDWIVVAGQGADSVEFIFSFNKRTKIDIGKGTKTIVDALKAAGVNTTTISKFTSIVDSSKYYTRDSLYYKCILRDPNSLFRVQVMKKQGTKFDPRGDRYRLYFPPIGSDRVSIPDSTILTYGEPSAITQAETPRFGWMTSTNNNVAFKFKLTKVDKKLVLGVYFQDGIEKYTTFQKQENDEYSFWQETKLIHSFKGNNSIRKLIYVSVYAKQLDKDRVLLINKQTSATGYESKISYMSYPEIKVKYLN